MKFIDQVSPEKLRGGFYTPARLVRACFDRIESLADKDGELSILEPAAGDGAFVRFAGPGCPADAKFTCVELIPEEAEKCRRELEERRYQGRVINDSFFAWAVKQPPEFSALVGNPPFVRYQFVEKTERQRLNRIMASGGKSLAGVANLWIPFTLLSFELLRQHGAFALILPSELLAIQSAGLLRSELIRHADRYLPARRFRRNLARRGWSAAVVMSPPRPAALCCFANMGGRKFASGRTPSMTRSRVGRDSC